MREKANGKWTLRGTRPHLPLKVRQWSLDSKYFVTDTMDATVPGGIHYDLFRNGDIENPYKDSNSTFCEWTESRWWVYEADIEFDPAKGKKRYIVFDGLDYGCRIFINGKEVASHENMFTPCRVDISDQSEAKVNVKVLFTGIPYELGQCGKTSETFTQKSRFGYGWDFATRLVNIGIWKNVWIEYVGDVSLEGKHITTDFEAGTGIVDVKLDFGGDPGSQLKIQLTSPQGELVADEQVEISHSVHKRYEIKNPELWYPNGMGSQPLYTLKLAFDGEEYEYKIGIRSLKYKRNPGSREDSIAYTIVINGKDVYIRGNNKVPFDHLYGNVDIETMEWYVKALKNENVNMVRVWGGGIIETEEFYKLCDENGIMIWQDFIQSSSGEENVPSKKEIFLEKIKEAAVFSVKERRNHTCLTIWCGGNELTDEGNKPTTYEDENIKLLKDIVSTYDPQRHFLPSTPSGPVYVAEFESSCNEDVHGPWEYYFETHYQNYNKLNPLLHSEFGVSCPGENHKKFLTTNKMEEDGWNSNKLHGEYWWHSYMRDLEIFGKFESVDEYIPYGQWIQAEALRYIIENERRKSPRTSGSMIWQLNEPWPNSDNSAIVDYFGHPKMGYYWAKKSFSSCDVSLKYDSLSFDEALRATVCLSGDYKGNEEKVFVGIYEGSGKQVKTFDLSTKELPFEICEKLSNEDEIYMVRLTFGNDQKDYFFSRKKTTPYAPSRAFEKTTVSCETKQTGTDGSYIFYGAKVKNTGNTPAYFVRPKDKNGDYAILASDAYFTLLPKEEKEITLTARKNLGLFFEKTENELELIFEWINK